MDRLAVFRALGDSTRYAIYEALASAVAPLSVRELAERLDLHPNTVRPHLEQMRDVNLVEVSTRPRGTVGRPEHRYALAPAAPGVGLDTPPPTPPAGKEGGTAARIG